ncbi:hypothetical protein CHLNCDRAFT_145396 [Chlorella variabilis]|uniref:CSD domain-containing protein n=1 Tax=Chlorella variabilis TaxID=554065 RepID=E1ZEB9_CHLVA|nr:hypothetical protein CHLNCDRAFT_145396 [Chlorella variabilis]EFN56003.1 hypothetical protein CHLNCDRAFT_145396 [Chlorella variabilis]|eukprot:XP_005848105.1 hypothetical protein CHLNCDRAFT_145396 [Chlorella variabilis]
MGEPEEPQATERKIGTVKWFNSTKGYGFITCEESEDEVFVHQSNIETTGYRSLKEGEEVEFDLVVADDGKKKAFRLCSGIASAAVAGQHAQAAAAAQQQQHSGSAMGSLGSLQPPPMVRPGYGGGRGGGRGYDPAYAAAAAAGPYGPYAAGGRGGAGRGAYWGPEAYMGYYSPMGPGAYYAAAAATAPPAMFPRGRGGFFPGGKNWAGARPPPPGQPGFSSGLQVVVHNLPWDCTWQQLKDAFTPCGDIERADVVFDSRGRSRGFGIVRFPTKEMAETAVNTMNNTTIGGRVVSVRIDRFA